jgi:hypothetical protein
VKVQITLALQRSGSGVLNTPLKQPAKWHDQRGHTKVTFADVKAAMIESVMPSDSALNEALAHASWPNIGMRQNKPGARVVHWGLAAGDAGGRGRRCEEDDQRQGEDDASSEEVHQVWF